MLLRHCQTKEADEQTCIPLRPPRSSRRRPLLTCAPLRTGLASWPRIRLKHGSSSSFKEPALGHRSRRIYRWRFGIDVDR